MLQQTLHSLSIQDYQFMETQLCVKKEIRVIHMEQ